MIRRWMLLAGFCMSAGCMQPQMRLQSADDADRSDRESAEIRTIGDISTMSGVEPVPVAGIGLVTGLDGTGGGVPPGAERIALEEAMKSAASRTSRNYSILIDYGARACRGLRPARYT